MTEEELLHLWQGNVTKFRDEKDAITQTLETLRGILDTYTKGRCPAKKTMFKILSYAAFETTECGNFGRQHDAIECGLKPLLTLFNPVKGMETVSRTCVHGARRKRSSLIEKPFWLLSLSLPRKKKGVVTLEKLWDNYVAIDHVTSNNVTSECKELMGPSAKQEIKITLKINKVLAIYVKRMGTSNKKSNKRIKFPTVFQGRYATAFIQHVGDASSGHYITVVKGQDSWYLLDDVSVNKIRNLETFVELEKFQRETVVAVYSENPNSMHIESIGLNNYGNTCFFNAALQVILHTPELMEFLSSKSVSELVDIILPEESKSDGDSDDDEEEEPLIFKKKKRRQRIILSDDEEEDDEDDNKLLHKKKGGSDDDDDSDDDKPLLPRRR